MFLPCSALRTHHLWPFRVYRELHIHAWRPAHLDPAARAIPCELLGSAVYNPRVPGSRMQLRREDHGREGSASDFRTNPGLLQRANLPRTVQVREHHPDSGSGHPSKLLKVHLVNGQQPDERTPWLPPQCRYCQGHQGKRGPILELPPRLPERYQHQIECRGQGQR